MKRKETTMHKRIRRACGALILASRYRGSYPIQEQLGDVERILMVQKGLGAHHFPGIVSPPTGIINRDESFKQAVERELLEELQISFHADQETTHAGSKDDYKVDYRQGNWEIGESGIQLSVSPSGIYENIGFMWHTLEEAYRLGEGFVFQEAITKLQQ